MSTAAKITALTISPRIVVALGNAHGAVTLSEAQPTARTMALTISDPSVAAIPASITVPPGKLTAHFVIATRKVERDKTVTITARGFGSGSKSVALTVTPTPLGRPPTEPVMRW